MKDATQGLAHIPMPPASHPSFFPKLCAWIQKFLSMVTIPKLDLE
jgi:hypothetical protein